MAALYATDGDIAIGLSVDVTDGDSNSPTSAKAEQDRRKMSLEHEWVTKVAPSTGDVPSDLNHPLADEIDISP
jgi:hypothetical protein